MSEVTFLPSDENTLSVEWNRPHSDAPILHYEIRYRQQTGDPSWQGPVTATTKTVTLHSLVHLASYGVQVRAVSRIGAGRYSSEVSLRGYLRKQTHTHTHAHTILKKVERNVLPLSYPDVVMNVQITVLLRHDVQLIGNRM